MPPVPKVKEYAPVEGRFSEAENVVAGGPAVVSVMDKEVLPGIGAPPAKLTVPERVAAEALGAVKLSGLVMSTDPKSVVALRPPAVISSCASNVPLGRDALYWPWELTPELVVTERKPGTVVELKLMDPLEKDGGRFEIVPVMVDRFTVGTVMSRVVAPETVKGVAELESRYVKNV